MFGSAGSQISQACVPAPAQRTNAWYPTTSATSSSTRSAPPTRVRSLGPLPLDMLVEAAKRTEDRDVVAVIGADLYAVLPGDRKRDFQDVDRIQTQSVAVQGRLRVDLLDGGFEIQRGDDQLGELALLLGHGCDIIHGSR